MLEYLPLAEPELELPEEVSTRKLNEEARRRGVDPKKDSRADVLAEIKSFDTKDLVSLQLLPVVTRQARGRYGSETAFVVEEKVMEIGDAEAMGARLLHVRIMRGMRVRSRVTFGEAGSPIYDQYDERSNGKSGVDADCGSAGGALG